MKSGINLRIYLSLPMCNSEIEDKFLKKKVSEFLETNLPSLHIHRYPRFITIEYPIGLVFYL